MKRMLDQVMGHWANLGTVCDGWSTKNSGDRLVCCGLFRGSLGYCCDLGVFVVLLSGM